MFSLKQVYDFLKALVFDLILTQSLLRVGHKFLRGDVSQSSQVRSFYPLSAGLAGIVQGFQDSGH